MASAFREQIFALDLNGNSHHVAYCTRLCRLVSRLPGRRNLLIQLHDVRKWSNWDNTLSNPVSHGYKSGGSTKTKTVISPKG
jgi:hypothetical protein